MTMITTEPTTRPLDAYRQEQLVTVAEFAARLGISEQTYRRVLREPHLVRMKTKRQICDRLGVSPYHIQEIAPAPAADVLARVDVALAEADAQGWIACDPETLEPTGEVFTSSGERYA